MVGMVGTFRAAAGPLPVRRYARLIYRAAAAVYRAAAGPPVSGRAFPGIRAAGPQGGQIWSKQGTGL